MARSISIRIVLLVLVFDALVVGNAQGQSVVIHGQSRAAIVTGQGPFYGFVAGELQKYIERLSGARLEIVGAEAAREKGKDLALLLVGGPEANPLVRQAVSDRLVNFDGLKADGFIVRSIHLNGRAALVVGGNDEAGTMYAVYDLLERYGAVFLLTGDILPEKKLDLSWLKLDVRQEPAFPRRGLNVTWEYETRSIMSLEWWHRWFDQMAKQKMNYAIIEWYPYEPWLKYDYQGEVKRMGDVSKIQTGYMLRARDFGQQFTSELEVGQEDFKKFGVYPRLAPPEFQVVKDNEQAFALAQNFLKDILTYASSRKIKIWLAIDAVTLPPNIARYTTTTGLLPFDPIFGDFVCPQNPVTDAINENRLKALANSYPEAEGFYLWMAEAYPICGDTEADRQFYWTLRPSYLGEVETAVPWLHDISHDNGVLVDSNAGQIHTIKKIFEARDRIAPGVKLGIGGFGRLFLWPYIDKMFSKDVPFADMEAAAVWTPMGLPMEIFGEMKGRENILMPRIDDDSAGWMEMQFNLGEMVHDRVLDGSQKYGVAGLSSWILRDRGHELTTRYLADGMWHPELKPDQFYRDYAARIFGESAASSVLAAFNTLEAESKSLQWQGRWNFSCCFPPPEVSVGYDYSKQPDPYHGPSRDFNPPNPAHLGDVSGLNGWSSFISDAHDRILYFSRDAELLRKALEQLQAAQPPAAPGSQSYLAYLMNRTEAQILHLETLITWDRAYIDFDRAFNSNLQATNKDELVKQLDASLEEFREAHRKARATAEKWEQIIDYPSDLGVLYRINTWILGGTELVEQLMQNVDNYYHGRDYLAPVEWGKVFAQTPELRGHR